jgi:hypothetical protein
VWRNIHVLAVGALVDSLVKVRYNVFLREHNMDAHAQITNYLLQVQQLLEDQDLGEHPAIQDAFNALVCAIDDELMQ